MLCEVAQQCIDSFQPFSIQKGIDIYLNCATKIPIRADRKEIEIVLNNLLSNAIKYNKEGGRVDLSLGVEDKNALIRVEDTGIGMKPEDLEKLFVDFVRIKTEETKHISGSGLGLSIVKKILDMYEAKITVESMPGQGSSFTVHFPLDQ